MNLNLRVALSLCFLFTPLAVLPTQSPTDAKPNIVILLADDLGYADVGFQGCRDIPTPHIDRLAALGVRCTSGYASHPYCSPMRAGLMAGRYQHRLGYERNIAYDPQNPLMGLPQSEKTLAARLKEVGYATGAFGKWHLGAHANFAPNNRGFDCFYGFRGGGHDYFAVDLNRPMSEGYRQPLERNGRPEPLEGYLTTLLAEEAAAFIARHAAEPFFVYLAFNAPHTPLQAPQAYLEKFAGIPDPKRRAYAAMVNAMDDGIGQVLSALAEHGLTRKTVVFFLSDNGGPEDANASDNGPLRGQKGQVLEGGIRVPFLVSWPGNLPEDITYDSPVISLDVARTALELAGAPVDENLEGIHLIPYLRRLKSSPVERTLFWRMEDGQAWAVRQGDWKLVKPPGSEAPGLYNLKSDLGETTNLADGNAATVQKLTAAYEEWNRLNLPPFFPGFRQYHPRVRELYREISAPPPVVVPSKN